MKVHERPGFLRSAWEGTDGAAALVDFGLSREFMVPIRMGKDFEVDPLIPIVAALADLQAGEVGILQVLFESVRSPWADSILRAVTDDEGMSFFVNAPELPGLARTKVSHPLVAAVLRVGTRARTEQRAWEIAKNIGSALSQFTEPLGNEFIPLLNDGYPDNVHADNILQRTSHRSGMLLNVQELVSLVHLPSISVRSPKFRNANRKTAFAGIPDELRSRHVYIAGATQHGKSTFIERLALSDIEHGHGICILDPKGDLVKSIIHKIPEGRAKDTILLEAANPVPIDFMGWETEQERQTLAADIFQTFLQFSTMTAGDQWLSVLPRRDLHAPRCETLLVPRHQYHFGERREAARDPRSGDESRHPRLLGAGVPPVEEGRAATDHHAHETIHLHAAPQDAFGNGQCRAQHLRLHGDQENHSGRSHWRRQIERHRYRATPGIENPA